MENLLEFHGVFVLAHAEFILNWAAKVLQYVKVNKVTLK